MSETTKQASGINFRQMTEEDISAVTAIDSSIRGDKRAMTFADMPSDYLGGELSLSIVAEKEGEVIGFVMGRVIDSTYARADTGWIQAIGVDPGYWRHGIGTNLVEAFMEQCRRRGIRKIRTLCSWRDWWMLSFVRSLGFSQGEMVEYEKLL